MATRGFEGVTAAEVAKMGRQRVRMPGKARSKYGATPTTVDNIRFDSAKEARRYQELLNLARIGAIRGLRVQPRYTLCALVVAGAELADVNAGAIVNRRHPVCEYVADFEYQVPLTVTTWRCMVEDVKSPATKRKEVYRLKRKMFEAQYGVTIREV